MGRFENIPSTADARLNQLLYRRAESIYALEQTGYETADPLEIDFAERVAANALEEPKADGYQLGHIAASFAAVAEDYQQNGGSDVQDA